jgi:hypothetical protein
MLKTIKNNKSVVIPDSVSPCRRSAMLSPPLLPATMHFSARATEGDGLEKRRERGKSKFLLLTKNPALTSAGFFSPEERIFSSRGKWFFYSRRKRGRSGKVIIFVVRRGGR